jgi:hypothetical protein
MVPCTRIMIHYYIITIKTHHHCYVLAKHNGVLKQQWVYLSMNTSTQPQHKLHLPDTGVGVSLACGLLPCAQLPKLHPWTSARCVDGLGLAPWPANR